MDDVTHNGYSTVYWAESLASLMDDAPGRHIARVQCGQGLPKKKEIIECKKNLDKAFEKWLRT